MPTPGADELVAMPVETLAAALADRAIGALEVVDAFLSRIENREPLIRAWTVLDPERARAEARALDSGPIRGPLHGLPIGVKDIIDTADFATAYGSPIYAGHRPAADAACVAHARRAGAVVFGKTASTEFATFRPTETRNPHDPDRTPGGSSSGSAAAVADRMVPLAFGTQTLGSVIRPASYCGVVGYKPTFAMLPAAGVKLIAPSLDTIGVFAASVQGAARLVGTVAGRPDLLRIEAASVAPRVGICRTHEWPAVEAETADALEQAAAALAAVGAIVKAHELPAEYALLGKANETIYGFELARQLANEHDNHRLQLSDGLAASIEAARRIDAADYRRAVAVVQACRVRFAAALGDNDVLLTASATGEAPAGLAATGSPVMNRLWTLLGAPAINLPCCRSPRGLPVGLQAVGRRNADTSLLAAAEWMLTRMLR